MYDLFWKSTCTYVFKSFLEQIMIIIISSDLNIYLERCVKELFYFCSQSEL